MPTRPMIRVTVRPPHFSVGTSSSPNTPPLSMIVDDDREDDEEQDGVDDLERRCRHSSGTISTRPMKKTRLIRQCAMNSAKSPVWVAQ